MKKMAQMLADILDTPTLSRTMILDDTLKFFFTWEDISALSKQFSYDGDRKIKKILNLIPQNIITESIH